MVILMFMNMSGFAYRLRIFYVTVNAAAIMVLVMAVTGVIKLFLLT